MEGTVTVVVGWFVGHMLKIHAKCSTHPTILCKTTWRVASWRRAMCVLHLSRMEFDVVSVIRLRDVRFRGWARSLQTIRVVVCCLDLRYVISFSFSSCHISIAVLLIPFLRHFFCSSLLYISAGSKFSLTIADYVRSCQYEVSVSRFCCAVLPTEFNEVSSALRSLVLRFFSRTRRR